MFGRTWKLGRIAGIEIRIDSSWAIIALLVTYTLSLYFDDTYPELSYASAFLLGLGAAVLFFASVLFHELAHSIMARRRGMKVRGITLFLFGGATEADVAMRGPMDEMVVTVVGPFSSLLLAGAFGGVAIGLGEFMPRSIAGAFGYLAWINLALAAFNLLPGFPLDGGRILRALVWRATGDLARATRVAARSGQIVGYLIVGVGIVYLFSGVLVTGIWFAMIGWFLARSAQAAATELLIRDMIEHASARDVMSRGLVSIPAASTVQEAVDAYFMRHDVGAFPVNDEQATIGLLTLRAVRQIPRDRWAGTRVDEAMRPIDDRFVVTPGTSMETVISTLGEDGRVLVRDEGAIVGIITPQDIATWLRRRRELGMDEREAA